MLTKIEYKKKWIELSMSLMVLKGIKLNIIYPLLGLISIYKDRKISKEIIPMLGLCVIGVILGLYYKDFTSIVRVIQLLGIVLAGNYLVNNKIDVKVFARSVLTMSLLVLCYDLIRNEPLIHHYFGQGIPRYKGIIREYNFSGALYFTLFVAFERLKLKKEVCLSLLLLFSTFSRGAMVCLALYPIMMFLLNTVSKVKYIVLAGVVVAPFLVFSINSFNKPLYNKLDKLSSYRFSIQKRSFEEVVKKPIGVGYFRGREILHKAIKNEKVPFDASEPHNIFIQVIYEFGFLGFALFITSMFMFLKRAREPLPLIMGVILFSNLNGLHELAFYTLVIILPMATEQYCHPYDGPEVQNV